MAHILIVDDSPVIRRIISTVLRNAGYETSEAPNGVAALERLWQPDAPQVDRSQYA